MEKIEAKKNKKRFNILEIAATDKENITSKINRKKMNLSNAKASHCKKLKKNSDLNNKVTTQLKTNINENQKELSIQLESISETDLTVDNPSENYWKKLAESCKKALDTALKENVDLHNKVNELEYENNRLKTMLDEAKSLVEVLTEMIEEKSDNANNDEKEDGSEICKEANSADSDLEDMSFQSCS